MVWCAKLTTFHNVMKWWFLHLSNTSLYVSKLVMKFLKASMVVIRSEMCNTQGIYELETLNFHHDLLVLLRCIKLSANYYYVLCD